MRRGRTSRRITLIVVYLVDWCPVGLSIIVTVWEKRKSAPEGYRVQYPCLALPMLYITNTR